MVVSGLDMAFWDALGRPPGGRWRGCWAASRSRCRPMTATGPIDPRADEGDIRRSLEAGFRAIKIKLGEGDLAKDLASVKAVRGMIGPDVALMVDYNQSLDPAEACRRAERLREFDLGWIEEPVRPRTCRGTRWCAGAACRCRRARTGGSRATCRRRSPPAPATSPCPT